MGSEEEAKRRKQLKRYIAREGLTCVMTDTKWRRLLDALLSPDQLRCALDYRRKDIQEGARDLTIWDEDEYHVFGGWDAIEWLDIRARILRRRGALQDPIIEDRTDELVAVLRSISVPFSLTKEGVRVWGYTRPGEAPEWA